VAGATQAWIQVDALDGTETIANFPLDLSEGTVLTTNTAPFMKIVVTENTTFDQLSTPKSVPCQPMPATPIVGTFLNSIYSAPRILSTTSINASFSDTLQETTDLNTSFYAKNLMAATDLSVSVDFIVRSNDIAYNKVIQDARRLFEPVWITISQGDASNYSFWAYGAGYIVNPTTNAPLKDIVRGSFSITWADGAFQYGTSLDNLNALQATDYGTNMDLIGVDSQTTTGDAKLVIQETAATTIGDSRRIDLAAVHPDLPGTVNWVASPAIGTFNTTTGDAVQYTITRPYLNSQPVTFTANIGAESANYTSTVAQFRDQITFVYNPASSQWYDSADYLTSPTGDSKVVIYVDKGSANLSLTVVAVDHSSATDEIYYYDGSYGLQDNSNLIQSYVGVSYTGSTHTFTSGKAICYFKTTSNAGNAAKYFVTLN
jgi:hypothetical protein